MRKRATKTRAFVAILSGIVLMIGVGAATTAFAVPLQFFCTGSTVCVGSPPNAVTQTTSDTTPTFNLITTNALGLTGTGFLAVLVPNGTANFTVTEGGATIPLEQEIAFTSGALGDTTDLKEPGMTDSHLTSFASASAQSNVVASSYTVSEFDLGAYSSAGNGSPGISGLATGPLPVGTVLFAWVETSDGALLQAPLSEAVAVVPTPGTMGLLGAGLLGVGLLLRKRLFSG